MPPTHYNDDLEELAKRLGLKFSTAPLDFLRGPGMIAERKEQEIRNFLALQKENARRDAVQNLLGRAALSGVQPTREEVSAFRPGTPFEPTREEPTPGLPEGTVDPALERQLRSDIRAEELNRAVSRNAPAVTELQDQLALDDAGIDANKLALARLNATRGADAQARHEAIQRVLNNPDADPLLQADIANNRRVSDPGELVKVRTRAGQDVYYRRRRGLSGEEYFAAATDEQGEPLRVPPPASTSAPTALQKDVAFIARALDISEAEAVKIKTSLKGKTPEEAWDSLVRSVAKMSFGRFARDPQRLHAKAQEIWLVARPGEPVPAPPPDQPTPAPAGPNTGAPGGAEDLYRQAREAIAQGANEAAVKARLRALGVDPAGLRQ